MAAAPQVPDVLQLPPARLCLCVLKNEASPSCPWTEPAATHQQPSRPVRGHKHTQAV